MSSDKKLVSKLQSTPFIGRTYEIKQLSDRLERKNCQLITIVGPGGIGKTRLALELLNQVDAQFDDTYFVPLQPLGTDAEIPSTVIDVLGIVIGTQDSTKQIIQYLETKRTLLILDNFEHVLTASSLQFISELLAYVPQVKLVITSREALNLREEWLLPLKGMQLPDDKEESNVQTYDAIRLFAEHARRKDPEFSITKEISNIVRICRQVEGLPLAIELSASWLRYMSCKQIAEEIAQDIASLETTLRNVSERHQSMRAVFDHSWVLLTEQERDILKRLSLFRGTFGYDAAHQISDVKLPTLTALVDKSMLHVHEEGRYRIHELLRQYCEAQLSENVNLSQSVHNQFREYYADFLNIRLDEILGGRQIEIMHEIKQELDNIRLAWRWAIKRADVRFFQLASPTLSLFLEFECRYIEGEKLLRQTIESLHDNPDTDSAYTLIHLEVDWTWFAIRLGLLEEAESVMLDCLERYRQLGTPPTKGHGIDPHITLGVIANIQGKYETALTYSDEVYHLAQQHRNTTNLFFAHYVQANALLRLGKLEQAEYEAKQAYQLTEQRQDYWFTAYCLNVRGDVARARRSYDEAKHYYRKSYTIRQAFDDPQGMAVALNHLGEIALLQNDIEQAETYYHKSLDLYEKLHDRGGLAEVHDGLGAIALSKQDYQTAQKNFHDALVIANDISYISLVFSTLLRIADLYRQTDKINKSCTILNVVHNHDASHEEARVEAKQMLQDIDPAYSTTDMQPLDDIVSDLIHVLADPLEISSVSSQQMLVEPLTDRELQVLRLLADGLTNREIADQLTVVVGTIKAHNHSIYGKLNVKNRTEAVACARELNLV